MIRRVVVTRPGGLYAGGSQLTNLLVARGYEAFELPLLESVAVPLTEQDVKAIHEVCARSSGVWLAFLSPTSVLMWRDLVSRGTISSEIMGQVHIAAQGAGTAEVCHKCFGRYPDFVPSVFLAEQFAAEFCRVLKPEEGVILPQAAGGRDVFAPIVRAAGVTTCSVTTYRLVPHVPDNRTLELYRSFVNDETAIIFMSPSAVQAAVAALGADMGTDKLVSIGPVTSQALRTAGFLVWREADEHSQAGVVAVLGRP